MKFLKKLFGKAEDYDEEAESAWYEEKSALMVRALGKEHDMVIHAIIGYPVGGALHGYLFPHGIEGTGLATKELARLGGEGSSNQQYDQYEFVMFTRHDLKDRELTDDKNDPHFLMRSALNAIAPYSEQATLNQYETLGFPDDWEDMAGRTFIMDAYKPELFEKPFGLMVIMEIFQSEFAFKNENGGDALLEKLKQAGHYPYSDMNREPVV